MNSLVSIIVPVYNADQYLNKCLSSLINQTYTDIEIILIDDGSKDKSSQICDKYATDDKRIIVVHKKNEGVVKARLDGYRSSHGRFITFVDADDYLDQTAITVWINNIVENSADILISGYANVKEGLVKTNIRSYHQGYYDKVGIETMLKEKCLLDSKTKKSGLPLYIWGKLYKKEVLNDIMDIGLGVWYYEDELIILKLLYKINSLSIINQPLYYYVDHPEQVTKKDPNLVFGECLKAWKILKEIDVNGFLYRQRQERHFVIICELLLKKMQARYIEYKNLFHRIYDSDIIQEEIIKQDDFCVDGVRWKIRLWLFRRKYYRLFYIIHLYKCIH